MSEETSDAQTTPESGAVVESAAAQEAPVPEEPAAAYDFATIQGFLGGVGQRMGMTELHERIERLSAEAGEREQRRDAADQAMRGFFVQELEKLRSAIQVELRIRAVHQVLRDILPVLNDLDEEVKALGGAAGASDEEVLRPLQNTRRRIYAALRKFGLEQLPVVEKETDFDPELHECVGTTASGEGAGEIPAGRIVAVKRNGYFFRGDLFQTPLVIIKGEE